MTEDRKFEEVDTEQETGKAEEQVKDGIVIYQTKDDSLGYQYIGDPSLKDVTYYLRLLEEVADDLWKSKLGKENIQEKQGETDA